MNTEEEILSIDNILSTEDIDNLFEDSTEEKEESNSSKVENSTEKQNEKNTTEIVDTENLFEQSESVGSEEKNKEDNKDKENTSFEESNTSPKNNFYSSIADAFKKGGVFPDLDDETIKSIKSSEDFVDLIEQQVQSRLDDKYKKINEALNYGVEPSAIKKYEQIINSFSSIKEESVKDESEAGEKLRKQLIYQDYINMGYSQSRAEREVQKSFNAGTDIEDALDALQNNISYYKEQYDDLIEEAKEAENKQIEARKQSNEELKKSILDSKEVLGDLKLDRNIRQKIYDNISKPIYKDPKSGRYLSAIQKYEMENRNDFLKNISIIYTLTDGFKNINGLIQNKVKKEINKGLQELEHTLNNTMRTSDGNLKFVSNVEEDSESFIGKGWDLDV